MSERLSQRKVVLDWLASGKGITSKDAFEAIGATRLSAIIFDLRRRGYRIESKKRAGVDRFGNKCQFVEYVLRQDEKPTLFTETSRPETEKM